MDEEVDWSQCTSARIRTDSVTTGAESPEAHEDVEST